MRSLHRAITLAALGLAAQAQASTDIVLSHQLDEERAARLEQLVERFNGGQKDVKVSLVRRADASAPAQLNLVLREDVAQFSAQRASFKPLHLVMKEAKEKFDESQFAPEMRVGVSDAKGKLFALPIALSTPVLYYNKALFRKAGLDPEKAPVTWWEVQTAAGKVFDSGNRCPYTTSWPAWVHIDNLSALNNAEVTTAKGQLAFNGMIQVKHIALLASWYKSRYFSYFGRRDEADYRFSVGECAMLTSNSSLAATLQGQKNLDFGVARLPYYDDAYGAPQHTLADGASLWVGAGRKPAEYKAVAKFVSFLVTPEIQVEMTKAGGFLPMTPVARSAARSKLLQADLAGLDIAYGQLQGKGALHPTRVSQIEPVRIIVEEELEAVWADKKPAKEALDTAVARGNAVLGTALKSHTPR